MSRQLDLGAEYGSAPEYYAASRERLIDAVRSIVDYHSHKVVAAALGRKRPVISQALAVDPLGRNGHRFYLDDLPWLVHNAPDDELVQALADLRRDPATPEEQLEAFGEAARDVLGPEVHKLLVAKARQRLARNRGRGR